ncbi:HNH endonuclease [Escherichia coli]|uniref:HNH endonuclease n=1 Tax=Escherichia coli TaxID=562 RepID=UPI0032B567DF
MITLDELKSNLSYDAESGFFIRKKSSNNKTKVGERAGFYDKKGYLRIMVNKKIYSAHRLAWFYVHGRWPEGQIDHINEIKDDNRISNLREVNQTVNKLNTSMYANNKTGVKGVIHNNRKGKKYKAYIRFNGVLIYLGGYDTIPHAKTAREIADYFFEKYGRPC